MFVLPPTPPIKSSCLKPGRFTFSFGLIFDYFAISLHMVPLFALSQYTNRLSISNNDTVIPSVQSTQLTLVINLG